MVQRLVPGVRSVGTLYNSSEANSVKVVGVARGIFEQRRIQLQEIAITGTSGIRSQVLTHRGVQALWSPETIRRSRARRDRESGARREASPHHQRLGVCAARRWSPSASAGMKPGKRVSKVLARVLRGEQPRGSPRVRGSRGQEAGAQSGGRQSARNYVSARHRPGRFPVVRNRGSSLDALRRGSCTSTASVRPLTIGSHRALPFTFRAKRWLLPTAR